MPAELVVAAWAVLACALVLAVLLASLRWLWLRQERLHRRCVSKWRPILAAAIAGGFQETVPHLNAGETLTFLRIWLHLRRSVRGEAASALEALARSTGCDDYARQLIGCRHAKDRLTGIAVMGYLPHRQLAPALWPLTLSCNSRESLMAAWALLQIERNEAVTRVLDLILVREDWSLDEVVRTFHEDGPLIAQALSKQLLQLQVGQLVRALRLLDALGLAPGRQTLEVLMPHRNPDVLVAVLRLAARAGMHEHCRHCATHPNWIVRLQVAKSLGTVGTADDLPTLHALAKDRNWWVRYRAAQALVSLPSGLVAAPVDRFAFEILQRVLVETGAGHDNPH